MQGMSKSSRTVKLIEASLLRLEVDSESPDPGEPAAMNALGVLDELWRLERKWRGQVEAGSPRRIDADFAAIKGWYKRWLVAARRLAQRGIDATAALRGACDEVERAVSPG